MKVNITYYILNKFQEPPKFRRYLTMLISEIRKISIEEFKNVFITVIENIMNIIANQIREVSF